MPTSHRRAGPAWTRPLESEHREGPSVRGGAFVVVAGVMWITTFGLLEGSHPSGWQVFLGTLCVAVGLFTLTSYVIWIYKFTLTAEVWSRTKPRRVARWVLVNGWRLGCLGLGLVVSVAVLIIGR